MNVSVLKILGYAAPTNFQIILTEGGSLYSYSMTVAPFY